MDRFCSREDVEFHSGSFQLGAMAREAGMPLSQEPENLTGWSLESWRAGWSDQDMTMMEAGLI